MKKANVAGKTNTGKGRRAYNLDTFFGNDTLEFKGTVIKSDGKTQVYIPTHKGAGKDKA